jgi:hypothetical protein
VAAARRQFIEKEHPMVCQRHLAGHRHVAAADQADIRDRVVRGATGARRDPRQAVTGAADNTREARGVEGLGEGHGRQDRGAPAGQHRLARSGWTQEQHVMGRTPTSSLDSPTPMGCRGSMTRYEQEEAAVKRIAGQLALTLAVGIAGA